MGAGQQALLGTGVATGAGGSGPGARVSRSTSQSISHNVDTAISFTTEDRDDGGFYDGGSPTRFTVATAGWYFVGATAQLESGSSSLWILRLRQNGSMTLPPSNAIQQNSGTHDGTTTALMYFAAGEYVEAVAKQVQGTGSASKNVENAALWIVYVGSSGLAVQRAANQVVGSGAGSTAAISWDTEDRDDNSYHDLVTNPTRLIAAATGWYVLGAYVNTADTAGQHTIVEARLNGTTIIAGQSRLPEADDLELTFAYKLTAGDYVEFLITQNSGSNKNVTGRAWMGLRGSGSGAYITRVTSQTVLNNAETALPFTADTIDDNAFHDTSSNTTRLAIRNTGWHIIGAYTLWDSSSGFRRLALRSGGTAAQAEQSNQHTGGTQTRQLASVGVYMTAADYMEETLFQTSGFTRSPATHAGWILELG